MLSGMALALAANTAHAKKIGASYTFGTADGGAYCDALTDVVVNDDILTAVHNYALCGYPSSANGLLGGPGGKDKALGPGIWYALLNSSGSYGSPYFDLLYDVNFGTLTFDAFYESAEYGYTFYEFIHDGKLIPGYGGAKTRPAHGSTITAALKAAKLLKK
jgi:hypothetical protein